MIRPLAVATEGWLTRKPLPIASSGYLYLVSDVVDVPVEQGGGGSKKPGLSALARRQLREDEEIMAIIMAATRMLQ